MLTDKEKLEEELKLLEESLNLEVITKEEYDQARQRIEKKLKSLEEKEKVAEEKEESVPITRVEEKPEEKKEEPETAFEISKGSMKVLIYAIAILVLAFGSYFFFFSGNTDDNRLSDSTVFIACSSGQDCKKEGAIGTCNNPGTEDAECSFVEGVKVKLIVLNSNNCFNCDTGRVLSILNGFFPNLEIENLGIETEEGKEVADKFDIEVLPAYILNSNLQQASNYHKFFNAFNKVGDSFVMKNTVANSNFYIEREEIPGKLDLVIQQNQAASADAEKNLKEFLDAFKGKVDFEKHSDNSALAKELGINAFPVFLVNNKVKFSGVQAADVIKENFCRMNKLQECGLELSKSLI